MRGKRAQYAPPQCGVASEQQHQLAHAAGPDGEPAMHGLVTAQIICRDRVGKRNRLGKSQAQTIARNCIHAA
jgi:hypothetical protein